MEYDIRKGHYLEIEGDGLKRLAVECFGSAEMKEGKLTASFGAITRLEAKILDKGRIDIYAEMNKAAAPEVQADTIKRWNIFLERATGFTSKERGKRLQKKAKEGKL